MKTKINDEYIDLSMVVAIGPLERGDPHTPHANKYIFDLNFHGADGAFIITACSDVIDPYKLESDANDAIKAKAKAAYADFVTKWQAVP